jgi:hypothetical protein
VLEHLSIAFASRLSCQVLCLVMRLTHPAQDGVHEREVLCRKLASRCGRGGRHAPLKTRYAQSFGGLLHPTVEIFRASYGMFVSIYVSYLICDGEVTDMVKYCTYIS